MTLRIAEWGYIRSVDRPKAEDKQSSKPVRGFTAFGVFLLFGMSMASLAGTTLVCRGTFLDDIWVLNPTAYRQLTPLSRSFGAVFLLLAVVLASAAVGWFRRRLWGWRLAIVVIVIQVIGDVVNLLRGDFVRGPIGIAVAGAVLIYLLRQDVKRLFLPDQSRS